MAVQFAFPSVQDVLALYKNEPISSGGNSLDIQNIRQDYTDIEIWLGLRGADVAATDGLSLKINNDGTAGNYQESAVDILNAAVSRHFSIGSALGTLVAGFPAAGAAANLIGWVHLYIPEYYDTARYKHIWSTLDYYYQIAAANSAFRHGVSEYEVADNVDRLTFTTTSGSNFAAGCTFSMYLKGKR